jgi:hypothetical protein
MVENIDVQDFLHLTYPNNHLLYHVSGFTLMQATKCPGVISRNSGRTSAHSSIAIGQRVRKRQPEGGFAGEGTSPSNTIR